MTPAREALDRTLLLMRDDIGEEAHDEVLLGALQDHTVLLVGDAPNLAHEAGQHAFVSTALLCARMGMQVHLQAPNVPLRGVHAPLTGVHLVDALLEIGTDLIPNAEIRAEAPRARGSTIIFGDTAAPLGGGSILTVDGDAWNGRIQRDRLGERWREGAAPFGPLASAGLAAAEVYKSAVRTLTNASRSRPAFEALYAPCRAATLALAGGATPPLMPNLGEFDVISGGAITHSALYALARIPRVSGRARVVEPERSDLTNLNRYALLRRSGAGTLKVDDLREQPLGDLEIEAVAARFDETFSRAHGPLREQVLVGVDDIPSRWAVQSAHPAWLGVGATTHLSAMASFHTGGLPCVWCLHPRDEAQNGPIPTVSFVSHLAGLYLAALFARHRSGERLSGAAQQIYLATLRTDGAAGFWVSPVAARSDCIFGCNRRAAA